MHCPEGRKREGWSYLVYLKKETKHGAEFHVFGGKKKWKRDSYYDAVPQQEGEGNPERLSNYRMLFLTQKEKNMKGRS